MNRLRNLLELLLMKVSRQHKGLLEGFCTLELLKLLRRTLQVGEGLETLLSQGSGIS